MQITGSLVELKILPSSPPLSACYRSIQNDAPSVFLSAQTMAAANCRESAALKESSGVKSSLLTNK